MAERVPLKNRGKDGKRLGRRGGKRNGSGRPLGSENEAKTVARAQAERNGKLPHEILLEWAIDGQMEYPESGRTQELSARERVACARACAAYFQHPKAPVQPSDAPAKIIRVEFSDKAARALTKESPDRLEVLREVLRALQAGGDDLASVAAQLGAAAVPSRAPDAGRYAASLTEDDWAGRA